VAQAEVSEEKAQTEKEIGDIVEGISNVMSNNLFLVS
jgi:hypothetical protein